MTNKSARDIPVRTGVGISLAFQGSVLPQSIPGNKTLKAEENCSASLKPHSHLLLLLPC